jgi:hypothetical protein
MRRDKLCVSCIIFILNSLLLTCCASAQCGDCDDRNPCTKDLCDGMNCQHMPQSCDDASSSALAAPGIGTANLSTAERAESSEQGKQVRFVSRDTINLSTENCDDDNPCTRDSYEAGGCVHDPVNCDDGNVGTTDFCGPTGCVNTPLLGESSNVSEFLSPVLPDDQPEKQSETSNENTTINESQEVAGQPMSDGGNDSDSIISENNSTALSSSEALIAGHPQSCDDHDPCTEDTLNGRRCEHKPKNCDDGNPNTFDYCFEGVCHSTTTSCDDSNPCTIDSYNGTACVHTPKNCNDGNPCTVDYCDPIKGCLHSPVVCGLGETCINGVCKYPYPYYHYDAPDYPYVAPSSALPPTQSYTIPAGTAITLPWAKSITALDTLKVENGIAYSSASPLMFVRLLGLEGLSIPEHADMIGLSWKDASFTLTLIRPDGSTLPVQGDNQNVMHLVGSNYDYYFLRSAAKGNWGIEVKPINPGASGIGYSLITGLVKWAAPTNQP